MIETLCRSRGSLDTVLRLLDIKKTSFFDQSISWQKAARELTIRFLMERDYLDQNWRGDWRRTFSADWEGLIEEVDAFGVHQELIQSLTEMQQRFFPDQHDVNFQAVCEELVQPLKGWWRPHERPPCDEKLIQYSMMSFHFMVRCNIAERLNAIGVKKWQIDVSSMVGEIPSVDSYELDTHFDTIHSKLVTYEQYQHAAFLLELALWKPKN